MLFWLGAFKYADASVASVLNETANIFIVIMAWLFLKEELTKRKIVGVSLTFTGVLVFLGLTI
jgi:DME family drug/metabolite transporter